MATGQTAVGIDIGAHALKAVAVRKRGTRYELLRAATVELGDLAFIDDSERKDRRLAELLKLGLRRGRIRGDLVGSGLAGRDYFVKYLHVPPTTPDKLRKVIELEVSEDPTAAAGDQSTDFWLLDLPTASEDFTALIAMARNETIHRRLNLLRQAGVRPEALTLNAVGLFYAYVNSLGDDIYDDKTTLLVDIGGRHLDVVIQRNAKLLFVRNLSLGGDRFTEAIQEEYHLPMRQAEELKIAQGALLPSQFDLAADLDTSTPEGRLSAALLEPAETIANTLQASIKYCQSQTRMPDLRIDRIVLTGRCARLSGLAEFLQTRMRVPVTLLDPFASLDTTSLPIAIRDEVLEEGDNYAVAVGLALRELDERPIRPISLLPEELRRKREFFARDFFVYASAVVYALAFAAMVYSSVLATKAATADLATKQSRIKAAETQHKQLDQRLAQNSILAGRNRAVKETLDTGRRTAEVLAILAETTPPQLRINAINLASERPRVFVRRGRASEGPKDPVTKLIIEGTVAAKYQGNEITVGAGKSIVDNFLALLLSHRYLYKEAKVTKYPDATEAPGKRTFKMELVFGAPYRGGG